MRCFGREPKILTGTLGRGGSNPAGRSGEANGIAKHCWRERERKNGRPTMAAKKPSLNRTFLRYTPAILPPASPLPLRRPFLPGSPSRRGIRACIPHPFPVH